MDVERSVIILDDEEPARQRLERLIDQLQGYRLVASCADGLEAIGKIEALQPDLALLDISMPGISGIEVARHVSGFNRAPAIIFCTAHDEYAIEAFDAGAVGYLMKPVRLEKLDRALASASRVSKLQLSQISRTQLAEAEPVAREMLSVKSRRGIQLIPVDEIFCFVADGKYVTARHLQGESILEESLNQLEEQFSQSFVRCHRSTLVRIAAIQRLDRCADGSSFLKLQDQEERLPVSRRHIQHIRSILLQSADRD